VLSNAQESSRRHQQRQRRCTTSAAVFMLAAAAVMAAACSSGTGSQPGASPVASLPGHSGGTAGAGKLTTAQSDQDMIDFAHCMRSHGVQMSDPVHIPGHSGLSIEIPTPTAATRSATNACQHFIAPIIAFKAAGAASRLAPQLAALTRYAQCMRGHDIGMLDPTPQGDLNLGNVPGIASDFGRYSPQFRAADAACQHLLPAGVRDDGTGP
jgi:hypothetical protein